MFAQNATAKRQVEPILGGQIWLQIATKHTCIGVTLAVLNLINSLVNDHDVSVL